MKPIYYADHAERYAHFDEDTRKEYPDEVYVPGWGIIKRVKDYKDMTKEDYRRCCVDLIRLAAKDIPLSRATPYH